MDLSTFSPDQLAQLKSALDGLTPSGRSPLRPRQLHDLRLIPTADDPRPTFFWSAVSPRDGVDLTRTTPFPRLLWNKAGEELTVYSAEEMAEQVKAGCSLMAPTDMPAPDPFEMVRMEWASFTEDERAMMLEATQTQKRKALEAKLSTLSDAQLQALLGQAEKPKRAAKSA